MRILAAVFGAMLGMIVAAVPTGLTGQIVAPHASNATVNEVMCAACLVGLLIGGIVGFIVSKEVV